MRACFIASAFEICFNAQHQKINGNKKGYENNETASE
jgi:hypothetical protein